MAIMRTEHPKPQFERANWMCLNGEWQFEIDNGRSGIDRKFYEADHNFAGKINVPFCPESKLSGVENTDFMPSVWYKRTVDISADKLEGRTVLHFGAVDYECKAYVNGKLAGSHKGGYASFSFDITELVVEGENVITVYAMDDCRDPLIPRGKQSELYHSHGCDYTRTTGIWQTVWLEFTPKTYVERVTFVPDVSGCAVNMTADLKGSAVLTVNVSFEGREVGSKAIASNGGLESFAIELSEKHLWEVGNGRLYDVEITYGDDAVKSYFGLRSIRMDGMKFMLNDKSVFQRLVLDQGFYPDGIYTAPSDEALENDIKLSMAMGFNGARLHEKVFEERFLYHCDRLGYIVWGEYANWGLDHTLAESVYSVLPEWLEIVKRDFNHPAIIGWCPYNETWDIKNRKQYDDAIRTVFLATKAVDPTRICVDTSGGYHVETEIYDVHNYQQDPEKFRENFAGFVEGNDFYDQFAPRERYGGQPMFVSEYGGILWSDKEGWGYGNAPKTEEEFLERFKGLAAVLLDHPKIFGLCYTQLTDVEQEQNGLYTYDRKPKFDPKLINPMLSRKAAIED